MTHKPRIAVTAPMPAAVAERAQREFDAVLSQDRILSVHEALEVVSRHDSSGLVISSKMRLEAAAIAALPKQMKIIATCSAGTDHIDLEAARARGLVVTNTPDVLTDATADLTFMLILNACRRARVYQAIMDGGWGRKFSLNEMLGFEVTGRTLGIVGMGRIGRALAKRAAGFAMPVVYNNRRRLSPELEQGATFYEDLRDMLPRCQILTLHLPGNPGDSPIMNEEAFALLPKGAVFINTARGNLVDESALIGALQSHHLSAAGLDVFCNEPNYDLRFRDLDNVFLTPHMGSATIETRTAMGFKALDNLAAVLSGNPPIDAV
jgi:lactate dehydrogenase-like 2-hydroxyacid dehydrogenase